MIRRVIFLILALFICSDVAAKEYSAYPSPKKVVNSGDNFNLTSRKIAVSTGKADRAMAVEIEDMLRSEGAIISSGLFTPKIVLKQVANIGGITGSDAVHIKVSKKRIQIQFTSQASQQRAIEILGTLITTVAGQRVVAGAEVADWDGIYDGRIGNHIDAASRFIPIAEIEHNIRQKASSVRRTGSGGVYILLVNNNNWRVETSTFSLINPKAKLSTTNQLYTHTQIRELMEYARRQRLNLIPTVELLSKNSEFETVTGHSLFSVEGMRFVRAILEEYVEQWDCRKICVGTQSAQADTRYMEFLTGLAANLGVEIVINKN